MKISSTTLSLQYSIDMKILLLKCIFDPLLFEKLQF